MCVPMGVALTRSKVTIAYVTEDLFQVRTENFA